MKKVRVPTWMQPIAEEFARAHCEFVLGLKPGSDEYKKSYEEALYQYLSEWYTESVTPHMNPTSPRSVAVFQDFLDQIFVKGPYSFQTRVNAMKIPQEKKDILVDRLGKQFRGAIITLAHTFLLRENFHVYHSEEFDPRPGSEDYEDQSKLSDFTFKKRATPEERKAVVMNRYYRNFIVTLLITLVEQVYRIRDEELMDFLRKALGNASLEKLSQPDSVRRFVEQTRKHVLANFKNPELWATFYDKKK